MSRWILAGASLAIAVGLAASPLALRTGSDGGPAFTVGYAFAKHGRDDRAGDDRGRGRGRGSDDKAGDDRGRGRGSDD